MYNKTRTQHLSYYLLIISILCGSVATQGCINVLRSSPLNIQIGSLTLEKPLVSDQKRTHFYNLQLRQEHNKFKQVVLSIIYIENYEPVSGLDYAVYPTRSKEEAYLVKLIMSVQSIWKSIHIRYLVNNRDDFFIDYFSSDSQNFGELGESFQNAEDLRIIKKLDDNGSLKNIRQEINVITYLSGIKSQDSGFNIQIQNAFYNSNNNQLSCGVTITNAQKPIQFIYFSIMIYQQTSTVNLTPLKQDRIQNHIADLVQGNSKNFPIFTGVTAILGINLSKLSLRRLLTSIQDLKSKVSLFNDAFVIKGIQIQANFLALNSIGIEKRFCLDPKQCENQGGFIHKLKDGNFVCVLCDQTKMFNFESEQCQCKPQYFETDNGDCVTEQIYCGQENSRFISGQCYQCKPIRIQCGQKQKYDSETKECVCNSSYERVNQKCQTKCPRLARRNVETLECQCILNKQFMNKQNWTCQSCPSGKIWDRQEKQCICSLPLRQNNKGQCVICAANGYFDQQQKDCVCNQGYEGSGVACTRLQSQNGILLLSLQGEQIVKP